MLQQEIDSLANEEKLTFLRKTIKDLTWDQVKSNSLLTLYSSIHSEIIAYESSLFNLLIAGVGLFFTGLFYGMINGKANLLALLPSIIAITYGLIINGSASILRLAQKKSELELLYQKSGHKFFDWETSSGAVVKSRKIELENGFIIGFSVLIFILGIIFTITGNLVEGIPIGTEKVGNELLFSKFFIKCAILTVDLLAFFFAMLTFIKYVARRRLYQRKLSDLIKLLEKFD